MADHTYRVKMVNYHAACDSALSVDRGALAAKAFLGAEADVDVEHASKDPAQETSTAQANLVFTDRRVDVSFFSRLLTWQTVNRIPYLDRQTLKVPLARGLLAFDTAHKPGALAEAERNPLTAWGFWATSCAPVTFFMPAQEPLVRAIVASKSAAAAGAGADEFAEFEVAPYYICKPNDGSQGQGIHIVPGLAGVLELMDSVRGVDTGFDGSYVVQPYLMRPALYKGVKFDLRVYVIMVGSGCARDPASGEYIPARAFMLRSGFARLCSTPYAGVTEENRTIGTMHIANDGVNFVGKTKMSDILRTTEHVFDQLVAQSADGAITHDKLWTQLAGVAGKVVTAFQFNLRKLCDETAVPFASETQHHQCYQLLGMDVMIDADGRMWLLECNAKPCMDWEKEDIDQTVGPEVNTEVMAIALSLGLKAGLPGFDALLSNERMRARTITLRTTYA